MDDKIPDSHHRRKRYHRHYCEGVPKPGSGGSVRPGFRFSTLKNGSIPCQNGSFYPLIGTL